jgi:hypothetical protein
MKKLLFTSVLSLLLITVFASKNANISNEIKGRVVEVVEGKIKPVPFALVSYPGTTETAFTNSKGEFKLPANKSAKQIRLSHAGYQVKEVKLNKENINTVSDFSIVKNQNLFSKSK